MQKLWTTPAKWSFTVLLVIALGAVVGRALANPAGLFGACPDLSTFGQDPHSVMVTDGERGTITAYLSSSKAVEFNMNVDLHTCRDAHTAQVIKDALQRRASREQAICTELRQIISGVVAAPTKGSDTLNIDAVRRYVAQQCASAR